MSRLNYDRRRAMAKVQYYCAATLDGYIAETDDTIGWLMGYEGSFDGAGAEPPPMSDEGAYERFYEGVGALISGSITYEFVLDHIGDEGAWPYAGKPYWVLSSRELALPRGAETEVHVTGAPVAELYDELAAAAGDGNIWVVGGGGVASQFAAAGLLDELLVTLVPVVLGDGKPLFEQRLADPMKLTGSTVFANGMVELRYELARG